MFVIKYQTEEKPVEKRYYEKLLSKAQDFTATFIKEAKILCELYQWFNNYTVKTDACH